eukprot:10559443-Alexandrium_andersonii.AAC.1
MRGVLRRSPPVRAPAARPPLLYARGARAEIRRRDHQGLLGPPAVPRGPGRAQRDSSARPCPWGPD